jgi:predicted protein tyrosine phosphatase
MIYVCSLLEMREHVRALGPSHLISLVAPIEQPPTPPGIAAGCHLRLGINDISQPLDGAILPEREHVASLVDFVRAWRHDDAPILVHCVAGISRSMAAALIALVVKANGREAEAAHRLRAAAPHALPNQRMIDLADDLLGCEGRLMTARDAMGAAQLALHGPLVRLPLLEQPPAG